MVFDVVAGDYFGTGTSLSDKVEFICDHAWEGEATATVAQNSNGGLSCWGLGSSVGLRRVLWKPGLRRAVVFLHRVETRQARLDLAGAVGGDRAVHRIPAGRRGARHRLRRGDDPIELARSVRRVHGIEVIAHRIDMARKFIKEAGVTNLTVEVESIETVPLAPLSYDVVLMAGVLWHGASQRKEDRVSGIAQGARRGAPAARAAAQRSGRSEGGAVAARDLRRLRRDGIRHRRLSQVRPL